MPFNINQDTDTWKETGADKEIHKNELYHRSYLNVYAKCPANRLTSKLRVWQGGKEGWKEEEGEGSLRDKSVPKKRFTQPELTGTWTGDYSLSWIRSQTG